MESFDLTELAGGGGTGEHIMLDHYPNDHLLIWFQEHLAPAGFKNELIKLRLTNAESVVLLKTLIQLYPLDALAAI